MQALGPRDGIDVSSTAINVALSGFELFPSVMKKILVTHRILEPDPSGQLIIRESRWFSLDSWLSVFETIRREIGPSALAQLGTHILKNPKFPAGINDVESALQSIDTAFHLSHRKNGVLMMDASSGRMLEGIGHYRFHRHSLAEKRVEMMCDTPYPCEIDIGIVTAVARRFAPRATVMHADRGCRRDGSVVCSYEVSW
jgi:hypothetical protein